MNTVLFYLPCEGAPWPSYSEDNQILEQGHHPDKQFCSYQSGDLWTNQQVHQPHLQTKGASLKYCLSQYKATLAWWLNKLLLYGCMLISIGRSNIVIHECYHLFTIVEFNYAFFRGHNTNQRRSIILADSNEATWVIIYSGKLQSLFLQHKQLTPSKA